MSKCKEPIYAEVTIKLPNLSKPVFIKKAVLVNGVQSKPDGGYMLETTIVAQFDEEGKIFELLDGSVTVDD